MQSRKVYVVDAGSSSSSAGAGKDFYIAGGLKYIIGENQDINQSWELNNVDLLPRCSAETFSCVAQQE